MTGQFVYRFVPAKGTGGAPPSVFASLACQTASSVGVCALNSDRSNTPTAGILSFGTARTGAAQASDSALTTASIEMKWKTGRSAAATFEGEFPNVTSSYAGKGVVRYAR